MSEQLLIRGGSIVTGEGIARQDILIEGERIVSVGQGLAAEAPRARQVEAGGLLILPGLIDVHVHLREPGGEHKEDFHTGTCAALAGGVTTVLAMPNTNPPVINRRTLKEALRRADAKAVCDYGLYVGATEDNAEEAARLGEAIALKMYMGSSTGNLLVDRFPGQIAHFKTYPKDRILAVHAEDEEAVRHYASGGVRRPPICAALGVARAITLAEQTGRRLHLCHVSTAYELALIRDARQRGAQITCEVTPHHLFLSTEDECRLGDLARVNPPLRGVEDIAALWEGLGEVDMIATDHAPHTLEEKHSAAPPSGMPGLETMLPLLLTAVHEGRLSLPDIVRLTASGPARAFRLAHKGAIAPGYDADLTLVDFDAEWVIDNSSLYTRCGWSPFAGRTVRGRVVRVYLRGRLAFEEGRVRAAPGSGRTVHLE